MGSGERGPVNALPFCDRGDADNAASSKGSPYVRARARLQAANNHPHRHNRRALRAAPSLPFPRRTHVPEPTAYVVQLHLADHRTLTSRPWPYADARAYYDRLHGSGFWHRLPTHDGHQRVHMRQVLHLALVPAPSPAGDPPMTAYTPRQLRVVAAEIERLTKARRTNETNGLPTTPDFLPVRFPDRTLAILRWGRPELAERGVKNTPIHGNVNRPQYLLDMDIDLTHAELLAKLDTPDQDDEQDEAEADAPVAH